MASTSRNGSIGESRRQTIVLLAKLLLDPPQALVQVAQARAQGLHLLLGPSNSFKRGADAAVNTFEAATSDRPRAVAAAHRVPRHRRPLRARLIFGHVGSPQRPVDPWHQRHAGDARPLGRSAARARGVIGSPRRVLELLGAGAFVVTGNWLGDRCVSLTPTAR